MEIVDVLDETRSEPSTVILCNPVTKVQSSYYCYYPYRFGKTHLGMYFKFEFSVGSILRIHKLNGIESFQLRKSLNK